MNIDYWQQFLKTGSVRDFLAYRNSINGIVATPEENEQSDNKSNRNSNKGNQDKGKR